MRIEVVVHHHFHTEGEDEVKRLLNLILKNQQKMGQELDALKAAVQKDTEVDQAAITLLNGLKAKLDAAIASGDPAQLQALSDQIGTSTQALADAVVANTPAENAPPQ